MILLRLSQVASLQEMLPGMVSTFFMSYIQEDDCPPDPSSGPQPMQTDQLQNRMPTQTDAAVTVTQAAGLPAHKLAMHTTASSAVAVPSTGSPDNEPQLHVPKIAFLYKCVLTSAADTLIAGIAYRQRRDALCSSDGISGALPGLQGLHQARMAGHLMASVKRLPPRLSKASHTSHQASELCPRWQVRALPGA